MSRTQRPRYSSHPSAGTGCGPSSRCLRCEGGEGRLGRRVTRRPAFGALADEFSVPDALAGSLRIGAVPVGRDGAADEDDEQHDDDRPGEHPPPPHRARRRRSRPAPPPDAPRIPRAYAACEERAGSVQRRRAGEVVGTAAEVALGVADGGAPALEDADELVVVVAEVLDDGSALQVGHQLDLLAERRGRRR